MEVCLSVFLIGLLAGAITNRGERMGCFGENVPGLDWCLLGQLLFGAWGPSPKRYSNYPIDSRCHDFISHLLGKEEASLTC